MRLNYINEGDILIFFAALNSSETEIPTLPLPVCSQKTIPSSSSNRVPYFLYHCPTATVENLLLLPDLEITVDFGPLLVGLSGMSQISARTQLPLVIGLSNIPIVDVQHTVPVTFIPGVNMAAPYIVGVRQVNANRALAAFGIFGVSLSLHEHSYIVSSLVFNP